MNVVDFIDSVGAYTRTFQIRLEPKAALLLLYMFLVAFFLLMFILDGMHVLLYCMYRVTFQQLQPRGRTKRNIKNQITRQSYWEFKQRRRRNDPILSLSMLFSFISFSLYALFSRLCEVLNVNVQRTNEHIVADALADVARVSVNVWVCMRTKRATWF